MLSTVTVKDETMFSSSNEVFSFTLKLPTNRITVRELIKSRVCKEVENFNNQNEDVFRGLVQPTRAENTLNGWKMPKDAKFIDWQAQFDKACAAFERNGFIVLVDDEQIEFLNDVIEIKPQTTVTFLKLVPLVGG